MAHALVGEPVSTSPEHALALLSQALTSDAPARALLRRPAAASHDLVETPELDRHAPLLHVGLEGVGMLAHMPQAGDELAAPLAEQPDRAVRLAVDAPDAAELFPAARTGAVLRGELGLTGQA